MGRVYSQDAVPTTDAPEKPVFRVLQESVIRQRNGDTVTFKKVAPPPALPSVFVPAQLAPVLSAEELKRIQRMEAKQQRSLSVSATVHAGGVTVLRWSCHAKYQMRAVSNVDFRHLAGMGTLETKTAAYMIFMGLGVEDGPLSDEEALAAKSLPADGRPSFALLSGIKVVTEEDQQAVAAMEALLDHYATHRAELVAQYEQREVQSAAREFARRNAPPAGPRHAVIQFWPLQPAQKADLQEKMARERGAN